MKEGRDLPPPGLDITETSTPHKHMQTHIAPPLPTTEGYPSRGIPLWMNSGVVAQPTPDAPRKKGNITSSHLPFIGTAVTGDSSSTFQTFSGVSGSLIRN